MRRHTFVLGLLAVLLVGGVPGLVQADEDPETADVVETARTLRAEIDRLLEQARALEGRLATLEKRIAKGRGSEKEPADAEQATPVPKDHVVVPRSTRRIRAHEQVTRDHVLTPEGTLATVPLPRGAVAAHGIVVDLEDIIGRVLRHDKPPGYVFTERDFYPKGTRPGPSAGVPEGKRAVRLRVSHLPGVEALFRGDRFDVVMAFAGADGDKEGREQASTRMIVEDGSIVEPVRPGFQTSASPLLGTGIEHEAEEDVVVAVAPHEVSALSLAIAVEAPLTLAVRSGRRSADGVKDGRIPPLSWGPDEMDAASAAREAPDQAALEAARALVAGTYELDADLSAGYLTNLVLGVAGGGPIDVAAIRKNAEALFETMELRLELKADGTFAVRGRPRGGAAETWGGTWRLAGRKAALTITHEGGEEKDVAELGSFALRDDDTLTVVLFDLPAIVFVLIRR